MAEREFIWYVYQNPSPKLGNHIHSFCPDIGFGIKTSQNVTSKLLLLVVIKHHYIRALLAPVVNVSLIHALPLTSNTD